MRPPFSHLICFSHLRWDFVFQRPQHLMSRLARSYRVTIWEEPVLDERPAGLDERDVAGGIRVLTPHLPRDLAVDEHDGVLRGLLDSVAGGPGPLTLWYYTPMMLPFSRHLAPACLVYDCMDELANFRFAPPQLLALETELLERADVVFTGGVSLYEAKRSRHGNVHAFPSCVDVEHFRRARATPRSGVGKRPRLGFYGVIDERMDLDLIRGLAEARPDWEFEIVGPIVKIDPEDLPSADNLFYPGSRTYEELPATLAGWDVALMPFAINDATRFISPTKTPEYLAAGRPVVSTRVADVVRHYADLPGVAFAGTVEEFAVACDEALALARSGPAWLKRVDAMLEDMSWDRTVAAMQGLMKTPGATVSPFVKARASVPAHYDVLVVGAGFAGSVMAERLAADDGKRVLVIDQRPHVAGNAFDRRDDAGLLIHQYGPHIFHTNSDVIVEYLSRFTDWRPYEHRVLAEVDDKLLPVPINRTTINQLYALDLDTDEAAAEFLAGKAEPVDPIRTSEDVVVSAVGRHLYETFFRGYTRKQWGIDPSDLDRSVTARVPTRTNTDDRYFTDRFQAMPADGYTAMFDKMLDHELIDIEVGVTLDEIRKRVTFDHLVFTGPIDEYFGHIYGKLPYRSLRFEHETLEQEWLQPVAVVNYPSEATPYTRITEYKHLTGDVGASTSITREFPSETGDPYYPIPRAANQALFKRYEALSLALDDVTFVGRLATYRYYNMDQVVGQALSAYARLKDRLMERDREGLALSAA
jgi:UDP-galactopyranose mutase